MWRIFKNLNIKKQLYFAYFLAVLLPVALLGSVLLSNTVRLLTAYHQDLLKSDNLRAKTILFQVSTQIYNISQEITGNPALWQILGEASATGPDFSASINDLLFGEQFWHNYAELEEVVIYTDNPAVSGHPQFLPAEEAAAWYQKALAQSSVFWVSLEREDKFGNRYWNLSLVQQIPLVNSRYHAVLVMKLSDNYLKTRLDSGIYRTTLSLDDGPVFFASERQTYGAPLPVAIDYGESYFQYHGTMEAEGGKYLAEVSTLHMYQSESRVYLLTADGEAYRNIGSVTAVIVGLIILAVAFPGVLLRFFTARFTGRILTLREAMYRASREDYEITASVAGQDEVSGAFADLKIMIERIREKDARMYETLLKEKELINEQQMMEFKMLASQINPHFLYNALEVIRMKAVTAKEREVATAIKLLGKSMRYVLENTGVNFTSLKKELDYIETYLAIQKLRFGEKFTYRPEIADDALLAGYRILPLLLQPIVENAILHGLEEAEKDGLIIVKIFRLPTGSNPENARLIIEISDNGCGMDAETLDLLRLSIQLYNPEKNSAIGLYNINQRLRLCYGDRYEMEIFSAKGEGTCVRLRLPLQKAAKIGISSADEPVRAGLSGTPPD